jgi:hypothetical protein
MEAGTKGFPPTPQLVAHQAAPTLVGLAPDVDQDHMSVQVGMASVVCHVLEGRCDHAFCCYLPPA